MTGAPGKCYVAGFGTTEWQGEASEELRSINVNIYNDRICQARLHGRKLLGAPVKVGCILPMVISPEFRMKQ